MQLTLMQCFLLSLPLIEAYPLYDFFHRVAGAPDSPYLVDKLADLWERIPESPSKSYVEKYIYYHLTFPSVDDNPKLAPDKHLEYQKYRESREYEEEKLAYHLRLREFRSRDPEL